ncbi:MAG: hypothetical protein BGO99_09795 [Nitrosospira sp. 56-18]|nr:MAG: hypothetical protein BGO99_09795 [Nitrosospira sp. 56-18]
MALRAVHLVGLLAMRINHSQSPRFAHPIPQSHRRASETRSEVPEMSPAGRCTMVAQILLG